MLVFLGCMSWICTCPALIVSRIYIYILYICVCVFLTFEWIYKYGYWDLPFVEKIDGGGGYRWTILVGRQRVDSRCFFQTCWFWIFLSLHGGEKQVVDISMCCNMPRMPRSTFATWLDLCGKSALLPRASTLWRHHHIFLQWISRPLPWMDLQALTFVQCGNVENLDQNRYRRRSNLTEPLEVSPQLTLWIVCLDTGFFGG